MRWTILVVAIGFALLAIASPGLAADQQPPGWQFEFMPYAWQAALNKAEPLEEITTTVTKAPPSICSGNS